MKNSRNVCVVCKENTGTCEDREAGGLCCGECLSNLININFELTYFDRYQEFSIVSQNPRDLVPAEIVSNMAISNEEIEEIGFSVDKFLENCDIEELGKYLDQINNEDDNWDDFRLGDYPTI